MIDPAACWRSLPASRLEAEGPEAAAALKKVIARAEQYLPKEKEARP